MNIHDRLRSLWDAGHRDIVALSLARHAFHALQLAEGLDPSERCDLMRRVGDAETKIETPATPAQMDALWAKVSA